MPRERPELLNNLAAPGHEKELVNDGALECVVESERRPYCLNRSRWCRPYSFIRPPTQMGSAPNCSSLPVGRGNCLPDRQDWDDDAGPTWSPAEVLASGDPTDRTPLVHRPLAHRLPALGCGGPDGADATGSLARHLGRPGTPGLWQGLSTTAAAGSLCEEFCNSDTGREWQRG